MESAKQGTLFVVATPIGNLDDITRRALDTLASVDVIAAEDTRHSRKLLEAHGISQPMMALHEHNESKVAPQIVQRLKAGDHVALISDAGTPLVSDPGFRLLAEVIEANIKTVPVPGASAVMAALSVAGLATDRFVFEGFLPSRQSARLRKLDLLRDEQGTLVFFESSHRIESCLGDLAQALGKERRAVLCRELTKRFETVLRGSLEDLRHRLESDPDQSRGEFVVVVAGAEQGPGDAFQDALKLARLLREYLPASKAARVAAKIHSASRRDVYSALEDEQGFYTDPE